MPASYGSTLDRGVRVAVLAIVTACAHNAKVLGTPLADPSATELRVPLTRVEDRSPERWRGLSNVFFDSIPKSRRDSMRLSPEWRHIEAAEVVAGPGLHTILALRFLIGASLDTTYLVDTEGTFDFLRAPPLSFERRGTVRVANVDVVVRPERGAPRTLPYQFLVSDDKYTYARIAEYRTGLVSVGGRYFAVVVRNRGRNNPFFAPDAGTVFLIDQDGDGNIAERATLTVNGEPAAAEQVMPFRPFFILGKPFEVTTIDSTGSLLRIRPAARTTAVSPNFRAPDLHARLLAGGELRLSQLRGRVVLLEFWATDCAFSERVRNAANQLATQSGEALTWIAMSKESDRGSVEQHLATYPMRGTVVLADSTAWADYNPEMATPHFVVIDRRGVVRFIATGATAIDVVAAQVTRLLAEP